MAIDWHWISPVLGLALIVTSLFKRFRDTYGQSVSPLIVGIVLIVVGFLPIQEISGGGVSLRLREAVSGLKNDTTGLLHDSNGTAGQIAKLDTRVAQLEFALAQALKKTDPAAAKAFVTKQTKARNDYAVVATQADEARRRLFHKPSVGKPPAEADTSPDYTDTPPDISVGGVPDINTPPCNCDTVSAETKKKLPDVYIGPPCCLAADRKKPEPTPK